MVYSYLTLYRLAYFNLVFIVIVVIKTCDNHYYPN